MTKKVLSKAEEFYISSHRDQPVEQIARDLGLHRKTVEAAIKRLPPPEPAATTVEPRKPVSDGFERRGLATVMTPSRSQADDEAAGTSPFVEKKEQSSYNKEFYHTVRNSIHIPDPTQPVR